ncbi:tyrosine-type recombinase/integrase [Nocardia sp. CA-128927]|uniref:tyrosine-type recombinase/integrase n=1 Tax=Nocardia sp. CA-128927 TaxID=3239975 RepID=UPI003D9965D2
MTGDSVHEENLAAAVLLLSRLGLTPADLQGAAVTRPPAPTFAAYIPVVWAAMPDGRTRREYRSTWDRLLGQEGWADRRIDEPTVSELKALVEHFKATRLIRRSDIGGRGTVGQSIHALRCLYRHAEADGLITALDNPAANLVIPRRLPSNRRALPEQLLAEINRVAGATGNDPDLDVLLLRLHTETACRRGGALALRPNDLDPEQCLVRLREKGDTMRWQPVSPTLMAALQNHARERGSKPNTPLLRFHKGTPLTRRRYDHLWTRLAKHIPAVATHGISTHWLRHTTLTWVERNFGKAVAKTFAGHTDNSGGATDIYTRAHIDEVAEAVATLTGEPHPLANRNGDWTRITPELVQIEEIT